MGTEETTRVDVEGTAKARVIVSVLREEGHRALSTACGDGSAVFTTASRDETRAVLAHWGLLRGVVLSTVAEEDGSFGERPDAL